jgi:porin
MRLTAWQLLLCVTALLLADAPARAQSTGARPAEDLEEVLSEAQTTPDAPISKIDRPVYRALQDWKKLLRADYGINWALEDTAIYQHTSGGIDADRAMVNTLGLFATWKIIRDPNGKDFAGLGFQGETRGNLFDDTFPEMTADLGTIWSPNDSTSDDYTKINQLWWGQRLMNGRIGYMVGKIDPGSQINGNRFAGSGNTQFFGQPYATNPARSFPDNGLGFVLAADPVEWLSVRFEMSDSDAVSTYSPFKTIEGHWFYAGEIALKPTVERLGQGMYRLMTYFRDTEETEEVGWALSADQNLSDKYGIFLRYDGNNANINAIEHLISTGFSFLAPFDRKNDQAGIGVAWTHPSDDDLRDEYSGEVYYRLQVTEGFELSASAQVVFDPSASDHDAVGIFGLRARLLY